MSYSDLQKDAGAAWEAFDNAPEGRILVGTGTCGCAAGSDQVLARIQEAARDLNLQAGISGTGCIGLCYAEPLVELKKPGMPTVLYSNVSPDAAKELLESYFLKDDPKADMALAVMDEATVPGVPSFTDLPMIKPQVRIVLNNCGVIDPDSLNHYIARGGYDGLSKALEQTPEEVIETVKQSGLRGRGGAGFPTATKWGFCRAADGDHKYMICNADEGDPGAFMDRSLIEGDPHVVLEGLCIAAYAIGASDGYIYVRAEYPLAVKRLGRAIAQAEEKGLLGDNILGSDFSFRIKIKKGAGAFVCGEETALLASIEGKRGMPRPRPPFPAQKGLFGCPTNINNVETLANVPAILRDGSKAYASRGTEDSRGTKTFALAGKILRTGLIEVPLGITLKEIVFDIGGGIIDGAEAKAVQTGGPSGGCIPASMFDLPVDYQKLAEVGAIMGSGGMVVIDENTCMVELARYFVAFTQTESCGKCVPCRLGTRQMLQILTDITDGKAEPSDIQLLEEIGAAVKLGSLCGLGQTAPNPVLTTIRYFGDEYREHIESRKCRAAACHAMLSYSIDAEKCIGCGACLKACPTDAVSGEKKEAHVIDAGKCISCGACYDACKFDAVIRK